jgi:hypothetical protein
MRAGRFHAHCVTVKTSSQQCTCEQCTCVRDQFLITSWPRLRPCPAPARFCEM